MKPTPKPTGASTPYLDALRGKKPETTETSQQPPSSASPLLQPKEKNLQQNHLAGLKLVKQYHQQYLT